MLTLLIIFAAIVLSGLGFWFYNRKQVNSLSEQIDDKNLVITALKNHVEESTETTSLSTDLNNEWRGGQTRKKNLTPSLDEALPQRPKKNKNRNQNKQQGQSSNKNTTSEKKTEQKQQTQKPKKNKNNG